MKRYGLPAAFALLPACAIAAVPEGIYVSVGAGADFLRSANTREEITRAAPLVLGPGRAGLGTGARGSLAVGYGFADGFRVELEGTAFGAGRSNTRVAPALASARSPYEVDGGGFVNAYYEIDLSGTSLPVAAQPYLGVGVGFLRTTRQDPFVLSPGGRFTRVRGDYGGFAAQGIAGVAFPIAALPGLAITAEYRLTSRSGSAYDAALSGRGPGQRVRLRDDAGLSSAVMVGVRYAFGGEWVR